MVCDGANNVGIKRNTAINSTYISVDFIMHQIINSQFPTPHREGLFQSRKQFLPRSCMRRFMLLFELRKVEVNISAGTGERYIYIYPPTPFPFLL